MADSFCLHLYTDRVTFYRVEITTTDGVRMDKFLLISTGAVLGVNARYCIGT